MTKLKTISKVVASVILWGVILLAALFSFTTLATKQSGTLSNFLGYSPLTVLTDSMKPEFSKGDMIIVQKCNTDKLEVGDIISFYSIIENEYALNTHRIIEIKDDNELKTYVTKGDANPIEDSHMIADGDIVGKHVATIRGMGKVMSFMSSSTGFLILIVLPMLVFLIYQVYNLITVAIKYKKVNAIESAKEKDEELANMQEQARLALEEAERIKKEAEEVLQNAKNKEN